MAMKSAAKYQILLGAAVSTLLTLISGAGAQGPQPGSQKLEPIRLALPQPMFEGTPQNLRVPNLEKPRYKAREPFLAPAGVKNIARRKPVTSGEEPVMGDLSQITDGDKEAEEG